jgi:hypothetical protein
MSALTHTAACVGVEGWAWRRLALSALIGVYFISQVFGDFYTFSHGFYI